MNNESKCPFSGGAMTQSAGSGTRHRDWWPNQLKLNILRQYASLSNPMDESFDYAKEFLSLDLKAVKKDILSLYQKKILFLIQKEKILKRMRNLPSFNETADKKEINIRI